MADQPLVVAVCEGNICRSPAMELLLRRAWGSDAEVRSAGTYAMVGWTIPDPMLEVLEAADLDGEEHDPTQLDEELIGAASLVLAAGNDHLKWILHRVPDAEAKTFLLTEAAALAETVPAAVAGTRSDRIAGAARLLNGGRTALAGKRHEDILDPYGMSAAQHEEAMVQLTRPIERLVAWIGP